MQSQTANTSTCLMTVEIGHVLSITFMCYQLIYTEHISVLLPSM